MGKQNLYEHSIGVPLIICGPGIPQSEKRKTLCYLYDVFPTLCQLTDLEIPETVQGESFLAAIENNNHVHRKSMVYAYKEFQRAYRKGDLKLIEYFVKRKRNTQLFNINEDPYEKNNLYKQKELSAEYMLMKKEMIQGMKLVNDTNLIYKKLLTEL
ncbi:MAG: hypothetical protein DRJ10_13625 [Bacteroidetes bacterium]|nr:MAG: hypothetical protein DRJ10_13625 [Bacteroidota bacterium]